MRPLLAIPLAALIATVGLAANHSNAQGSYSVPANAPAAIKRAIESSARSAEQRARDADRKPAETLMLAQINEGARVIELASFGHYYTTILTEAVGASGHVYMVDMPWTEPFGGAAARAFDAAHANATYTQANYNQMELPQNVDAVLNVLFYHDLTRDNVDTADMNRRIFAALKPGGIYLVIDHKAADGSGWRDASTLHRITGARRRQRPSPQPRSLREPAPRSRQKRRVSPGADARCRPPCSTPTAPPCRLFHARPTAAPSPRADRHRWRKHGRSGPGPPARRPVRTQRAPRMCAPAGQLTVKSPAGNPGIVRQAATKVRPAAAGRR
jgi:predicted methyltransferase